MSNTGPWLTAANPFNAPASREDAWRKARCGAIGLALTSLSSIQTMIWFYLQRDAYSEVMARVMAEQPTSQGDAEYAAMMQAVVPTMTMFTIAILGVFALIYAILALVQWVRPVRWIPIVVLALMVYGTGSALLQQLFPNPASPSAEEMAQIAPLWSQIIGYGVQAISAVLLVSSWRGAQALHARFQVPATAGSV